MIGNEDGGAAFGQVFLAFQFTAPKEDIEQASENVVEAIGDQTPLGDDQGEEAGK